MKNTNKFFLTTLAWVMTWYSHAEPNKRDEYISKICADKHFQMGYMALAIDSYAVRNITRNESMEMSTIMERLGMDVEYERNLRTQKLNNCTTVDITNTRPSF